MQVKGVGQRYAHVVLRKADTDVTERAGELAEDELERVITRMQNPCQDKIPAWGSGTDKKWEGW